VPICSIYPSFKITISFATSAASFKSCVTKRLVTGNSLCNFLSHNFKDWRILKSNALKGSSRSKNLGSIIKARANSTLCCCPPDS